MFFEPSPARNRAAPRGLPEPPPAGPFEFAVEWPFGGIDLTFTEFDGAAIAAAAGRSARYWPETG
jgi:hypothetical protein